MAKPTLTEFPLGRWPGVDCRPDLAVLQISPFLCCEQFALLCSSDSMLQTLSRTICVYAMICLLLSVLLICGSAVVSYAVTDIKCNSFLEQTAFETFSMSAKGAVKAYWAPFQMMKSESVSIFVSASLAQLRSKSSADSTQTDEWYVPWIERILAASRLNPEASAYQVTVYAEKHMIVFQMENRSTFLVANASEQRGLLCVFDPSVKRIRVFDTVQLPNNLSERWDEVVANPPGSPQPFIDLGGNFVLGVGYNLRDSKNQVFGAVLLTFTFQVFQKIVQSVSFPSSGQISVALGTSDLSLTATTFPGVSVVCDATVPFARCALAAPNNQTKCRQTFESIARVWPVPLELIARYPELLPKTTTDSDNCPLTTFFFRSSSGDNHLVGICSNWGQVFLFIAPSDIVLQDYSELMAATARTVVAVAIVFGVVMALVQFGVLVAVRRLVSKMMDACTNALDGVVKGHETGGAEKAPATFLSYFHETSRIVEANAALNKLVGDLMAALPSKEAPSALRRVRGQPDATGNPLAPPSAASSTQSTRDAPGENVASMLLFHIGTLSLLHRDDERSYCDIMSNALTIVHECGGVLERVAGGHFVASFNCHWPCERHAEVAAHAALKIHHLMQTHLAATPYGPGQSSTLFQGMAVGTEYCVIVDCAPFALHEFEEVGRTPEKTMRSSVVQSSSDELMMKLAPLVSALRFRVVVTSEVAHRIDIATCVIDSVESKERSLRLYEICDDDRISEIDQAMIVRGFAEMHGGRYEEALEYWRRNKPSEYRRGDRLEKVCEDMVRMKRTGAAPPVPYRRRETLPWEKFGHEGE